KIHERQEAIESLLKSAWALDKLKPHLDAVRDIERLMMKISSNYASPRDIAALRFSMEPMAQIKACLAEVAHSSRLIHQEGEKLDGLPDMTRLIAGALVDEPPARLTDGRIFRDGFHTELDELREISRDSKTWLARYQADLRETSGIRTLKV